MAKMEKLQKPEFLWTERKRHLGLPLSFTTYHLSNDRIFRETGLLNQQEEEVLLYRVRDLEMKRNLIQRIFGVGTVCIHSSDKTAPHLDLVNVKQPREVKELIFQKVEEAKDKKRIHTTEMLTDHDFDGELSDMSCENE